MLTTAGNLNSQIIRLAWPIVLQNLVRSLAIAILDTFWVGKMGSEYLASITVGTFLSWGVYALGETISIGTNSLVSQAVGAKQNDSAKYIGTLNLFNAVFAGIVIAAIVFPLLPLMYKLTNIDNTKAVLANQYIYPILLLLPCTILFETGSAIFRANGNTKTPFILLIAVFSLKIILSPLLIFTFNMGLSGASLATMISYGSVFIVEAVLLKKNNLISSLKKKSMDFIKEQHYNWKVTKETIKIGIPLSFEGLAFSFIYIFVTRFVAEFGTTGIAALGIGHRSEAIPYQLGEAFAVSASIIVGQNIGAGNTARAEKGAWRVLMISWIPVFFISLGLFFFPDKIAGFFTTDIAVINTAKIYNMIAAFSIYFAMSEAIFAGAFAGAGNSLPPLAVYLPITALRIPLCAILAPIYGMNGVWIAIFSTSIIKGILIAVWFSRGKWKNRKFSLSKNPEEEAVHYLEP